MKTRKCIAGISGLLLVIGLCASAVHAQNILNPFYTEPAWKLWYEDPTPVPGVTVPPVANWLFPDDADTVANPGRFLAYLRGTDWPQRRYAGFWYDVYASLDDRHSDIRPFWNGDFGNAVTLRPPESHMRLISSEISPYYSNSLFPLGTLWTSQSYAERAHQLTDSFAKIDLLERYYYFANILRAAPGSSSYLEYIYATTDLYDALVPVYYNSRGASTSETYAVTKMLIAGGFLPRTLKPELLRNGLFQSAMLYIWKAGLPYAVPYDHELRHRPVYMSYGDGVTGIHNVNHQVGTLSFLYDPTQHLDNMVQLAKDMIVTPPIALLRRIEVTGGTEQSVNKTAIRVWQGAGETVQVRVSVEDSYDLQGLPLTFRWKVLNGNKDSTVVHEGGSTYLITVPSNDALPKGRTVVLLVANNDFYDSNPATVNVYRTTTTASNASFNLRVPPVTGVEDRAILPGESVSYVLQARDPDGFPVSFSHWQGVGEIAGNVFNWSSAPDTPLGAYPVRIVASDGTNGNGQNGGQAQITVSDAVAEIAADTVLGNAPLTVNFSSAGSRHGGSGMSLLWNFDDGGTSMLANPSHVFTQPGIYEVSLTATGAAGSHTARKVIEVRHAWPLAINNGWSPATGVDPAVWNVTGASVDTSNRFSGEPKPLKVPGGAAGAPNSMTSVQPLSRPAYIEVVFNRPSQFDGLPTGIKLFGSLIGVAEGSGNNAFNVLIGHPSDTDPNVWVKQFLGKQLTLSETISTLRAYVEDDPENAGKIRYRGYLETELGRFFIKFGNQNPAEAWYNNFIGIVSETANPFSVWRYQVWTPTGAVTGPEINVEDEEGRNVFDRVRVNNSEINHKGSMLLDDSTEFREPATLGGSVTRTYKIRNQGTINLDVSSVSITGTNAADYMVSSSPAASVAPGETTSFAVTFTPGGPGLRLARVQVASNDPDEPSFTFNVRGWQRTAREINVEGNGANIASGSAASNSTDHTDFGTVSRIGAMERAFLIQNIGLDTLNISDVSIAGAHAGDFTIAQAPRGTLLGRESTLVRIRFTPGGLGIRSAIVNIVSDDADESTYSFAIRGTGVDTIVTDQQHVSVPEGGSATFGVKLSQVPSAPATVTLSTPAAAHLDAGITIQSATTLAFDAANWDSFQTVTLTDAEDDTDTVDGNALIRLAANSADLVDGFVRVSEVDNDTNSRPVAYDQSVTVDEDCSINITLRGTDGDTGASLAYTVLSGPSSGTLTGTPPSVTYKGFQNYSGPDSFTFKVSDGIVDSAPGTVSITVTEIDDALDTDDDGLPDGDEKCVHGTNPLVADTDNDALEDGAEILTYGTNPLNIDTDGDGIPDGWEVNNGTDPQAPDADLDPDQDGLTNAEEFANNTNPFSADTDSDGLSDYDEINVHLTNPRLDDTDNDGLTDGEEIQVHGTNPKSNVDTDDDGMSDDWESVRGTNPAVDDAMQDPDGDGYVNLLELYGRSLPFDAASLPVLRTLYVDPASTSGTEDGSAANPYKGIQKALNAARNGDILRLASATYAPTNLSILDRSIFIEGPADRSAVINANVVQGNGQRWGGLRNLTLNLFGLYFGNSRNIVVESNHIILGESLWLYEGTRATFRNNLIDNAGDALSGYWIDYGAHADIINDTIVDLPYGVLFEYYYGTSTTPGSANIRNTIMLNAADISGEYSSLSVSYSLLSDGQFAGTNGNITGDPLFVNAPGAGGGDYHLLPGSPAIDSGDPADDYSLEPMNNGGRINMGRYGNTPEATVGMDTDGDGLTDQNERCYDGDCGTYNPYDASTNPGGQDLDYTRMDTDGDGFADGAEHVGGSDPLSSSSAFAITSVPGSTAVAGDIYSYQVTSTWSTATYSLVSGPSGMAITPAGQLSWVPSSGQVGTYAITVSANAAGYTVTQTFEITVIIINKGDINADGVVDAADVALAERFALKLAVPTSDQLMRGDVAPAGAPDGAIDVRDLLQIRRKALGLASF